MREPPARTAASGETSDRTQRNAPAPKRRISWTALLGGLIVLGIAVFVVARWREGGGLPDGLLQANGRIEGDRVTVASKFAGRVARLAVREGATVRRGDFIAALDDAQVQARVDQMNAGVAGAGAAVSQARSRVAQADAAVAATAARIAAERTALDILESQTAIQVRAAQAGVDHALASLTRAESVESQALHDAERYKRLSDQGDVELRRSEQENLALARAESELAAARSQLIQAEEQLKDAQLGPQRIRAKQEEIRALEAQLAIERLSVEQSRAALTAADAAVRGARARQREAASTRTDLTITAPIDGVVMTRTTDEGEVVSAGAPLLTLVDLDKLYLRVFVPETQIGMVRLGLPARIYTDAFPENPFSATVKYISSRAEFTPREVQSPEERVKLVYAVKLYLDANPDHRITPGLPADAMIRWKDGTPWTRPRW